MPSAVGSRLAYARLSAVATASRLPTANRDSNNSYTTSWDTTGIFEDWCGYRVCACLADGKARSNHNKADRYEEPACFVSFYPQASRRHNQ